MGLQTFAATRVYADFIRTRGPSATFELLGHAFVQHQDVFPPRHFPSTGLFVPMLPLKPDASFLEIGCGTGVASVIAALAGCAPVVAVDINPHAVLNARDNSRLHGVENRVTVKRGDLFEPLAAGERFDVIYWNSNFVNAPKNYRASDWLDHALFDPGYRSHGKFMAEVRKHVTRRGRIFVGFSELGDVKLLGAMAEAAGFRLREQGRALGNEGDEVKYFLLELGAA